MFKPLCPYDIIIIAVGFISIQGNGLASSFSRLLKLEHFPCTRFQPCDLKQRSSAWFIDRFKSCMCSCKSGCVIVWTFSEFGSSYWYHNSYHLHLFLCHLNHLCIILQVTWLVSQVHVTSYCVALVPKLLANLGGQWPFYFKCMSGNINEAKVVL
jgi:hypothetical protein